MNEYLVKKCSTCQIDIAGLCDICFRMRRLISSCIITCPGNGEKTIFKIHNQMTWLIWYEIPCRYDLNEISLQKMHLESFLVANFCCNPQTRVRIRCLTFCFRQRCIFIFEETRVIMRSTTLCKMNGGLGWSPRTVSNECHSHNRANVAATY